MINRHVITKEQALSAVGNGEFGSDVIASAEKTVVIMTQDWCPYWADMSSWLYGLDLQDDIDAYELIYNTVDYFQEFMNFKENTWGNRTIPYLRYYKSGKLIKETNSVSKETFLSIMGV